MAIQRISIDVFLTPELEQLIASRAAFGCNRTATDAVRAGLGYLEHGNRYVPAAIAQLMGTSI